MGNTAIGSSQLRPTAIESSRLIFGGGQCLHGWGLVGTPPSGACRWEVVEVMEKVEEKELT